MSQYSVNGRTDLHPENPQLMKDDEEFPWFTIIMMALCLVTLIAYLVKFVIIAIKYGL